MSIPENYMQMFFRLLDLEEEGVKKSLEEVEDGKISADLKDYYRGQLRMVQRIKEDAERFLR